MDDKRWNKLMDEQGYFMSDEEWNDAANHIHFMNGKQYRRSEPVVTAEQRRSVPLQTHASWNDSRYSSGGMRLIFGTEKYDGKYGGSAGGDYSDRLRQWDYDKDEAANASRKCITQNKAKRGVV